MTALPSPVRCTAAGPCPPFSALHTAFAARHAFKVPMIRALSRLLPRSFARALPVMLALLVTFVAALLTAPAAHARTDASLRLYVGETRVIALRHKIERIAIGNGKVLSASSLRDTELLLVANDAGDSTITVWLRGGTQVSYEITVGGSNIQRIAGEIASFFANDPNVVIRTVGDRVFFEASDLSTLQAKKMEALEKAYPREFVPIIGGENNLQERTIHMSAQIVEIRSSALENLGIEWQQAIAGPTAGLTKLPTVLVSQRYLGIATSITSSINILEQRGDAYTIASPQLTSRCGGTADFTAGGELPIPTSSGFGQVQVEFKPYGIRLNIQPRCDTQGRIRAKLGAEVSQIDRSVTVLGVPGLLTRKAETELDLEDGRPMIISGLTSLRASEDINQVPGLGDVPVVGNLFRNRGLNGERTELVLLITPTVVTTLSGVVRDGMARGDQLRQQAGQMLGRQGVGTREPGLPPTAPTQPPPAGAATPMPVAPQRPVQQREMP
ncbi:MAG: hypothetical protein EOO24_02100 [Comamonadaceae bacterium]|nr:MAG: hypothetical protein EOO24_02100 [Comamonadaceae bacterium]